jgi:hypothetical protein
MLLGHLKWTFGRVKRNKCKLAMMVLWILFSINSFIGIFLAIFLPPNIEFYVDFGVIQMINVVYSLIFLALFGYLKLERRRNYSLIPVLVNRRPRRIYIEELV